MGEVPLFRKELIYKCTRHDLLLKLGYHESVFYEDHQLQKDWGNESTGKSRKATCRIIDIRVILYVCEVTVNWNKIICIRWNLKTQSSVRTSFRFINQGHKFPSWLYKIAVFAKSDSMQSERLTN